MALLTSARNTPRLGDVRFKAYPVEASTTLYIGGMVAVGSDGYLVAASAASGLLVVGVSHNVVGGDFGENAVNVASANSIPNPANLGAAGALWMNVARGTFLFDAASAAQTWVGELAFITDDHTVMVTYGSGNPCAGRVMEVTATGQVWVDMNQQSNVATATGH